jgi:hypothetical protein
MIFPQIKKYSKQYEIFFNIYYIMKLNSTLYNSIFTFVFGGVIVLSVSLLSENVSNMYASLLWAFPFTLIPTIYYLYIQNKPTKHIQDFIKKTNVSIIILFIIIALLYFIYTYTQNLLLSLLVSSIIYVIICTFIIYTFPF